MISTLVGESRSTITGQRGLDERHFARNLRGELDSIVMKALEKDRTRRYGSADALAGDCAPGFSRGHQRGSKWQSAKDLGRILVSRPRSFSRKLLKRRFSAARDSQFNCLST